ncbi:MAG: ATP-binding cassette domain-containing protein [Gammaproteobacteria bacterium]|nr:MAG: ATP-binding cassette domain-containing protein [Gammaproteobacteria bacterium]
MREAQVQGLDPARAQSGDLIVVARGLRKEFDGRVAVGGIDLAIPRGGCFGLLGPNGAGKTTTLRMILGQSPVSSGSLTVFGLPVDTGVRQIRARTGVVPQNDNADPDFTVAENLRMYARYFGLRAAAVAPRIRELLEFMELSDRANDRIKSLSGGMKRRLTIARALINDPELIVLDEPTTGLDPQVRRMIWNRLRQLRDSGKTLLLTTHYMDEAERLCDDLVVIDKGQIIAQGPPRDLIRRHVESHVIEIQGSADVVARIFDGLPGVRTERIGGTCYCYTNDLTAALQRLEQASGLICMHRPTTLEDVFLRLTGHELRE